MSPKEMERRVVVISERAYSTTVDGISRIESQSTSASGILKVYFEQGRGHRGGSPRFPRVSPDGESHHAARITSQRDSLHRLQCAGGSVTITNPISPSSRSSTMAWNFIRIRLFTVPGLATPRPRRQSGAESWIDIDPAQRATMGSHRKTSSPPFLQRT